MIKFYKTSGEHGYMSNFSKHRFVHGATTYNGIVCDGLGWQTSEHYFQAQKFIGGSTEEEKQAHDNFIAVWKAETPRIAAAIGRDKNRKIRPDWEKVKVEKMFDAIYFKFTQNADIADKLLSTGDQEIVEDSPVDWFWGCGADGKGENMLGQLLMRLRCILRHNPNLIQRKPI